MIKRETKKINNKAFTLVELLAVIIILGIILLIAIPSVTKYIVDSRSKTYIMIAQEHINGAAILVNSGKYNLYNEDVTYYIPGQCIEMENDASQSPFAEWKHRYVALRYNGKGFDYYWMSADKAGMGIYFTKDDDLSVKVLKPNVDDVQPDILIDGSTIVYVLNENCVENSWEEADPETPPTPDPPPIPDPPTPDPPTPDPPTPDPDNPNVQINETTWSNGPLTISISIQNSGCFPYGPSGYEMCNYSFALTNNGDKEMTSWSATFDVPEDLYMERPGDNWISRYASIEVNNGVLHIFSNPAGYHDIFPSPGNTLNLPGAFRLVKKTTSAFSLDNGNLTYTFISDESQTGTTQGGLVGNASDMNIDLAEINVELKRQTYWGSGGAYHAIYDVIVTNISDNPINGWSFTLELPTLITAIRNWNVTANNISGSKYLISSNEERYLKLQAGKSATINSAFQFDMIDINAMPIIE